VILKQLMNRLENAGVKSDNVIKSRPPFLPTRSVITGLSAQALVTLASPSPQVVQTHAYPTRNSVYYYK